MQSKNVLWLGALFVSLLIVFCIAKYMDKFYPNVETIDKPIKEIVDKDFDLKPIRIENISNNIENNIKDIDYIKVIKLNEKEEKDIEKEYSKALLGKSKKVVQKPISVKKTPTKIAPKPKKQRRREIEKKRKKISIETILYSQTVNEFGNLSSFEKQKLNRVANSLKNNSSSYIQIESQNRSKKSSIIKRYLSSLGISPKKIHMLNKNIKNNIFISDSDQGEIDIIVIKKD